MARPLLDDLLPRLDWPTPQSDVLVWDEVCAWPQDAYDRLTQAGVIQPTEPALSVTCEACDDVHPAELLHVDGRTYAFCAESGTSEIDPARLQRWRLRLEGVANLCGLASFAFTADRAVLPGRLFDLGTCNIERLKARVFLARGLQWEDAPSVLAAIRAKIGDGEALLLAPSATPKTMPDVRLECFPLVGNLTEGNGKIRFRLPPALLTTLNPPSSSRPLKLKHPVVRLTPDDEDNFEKAGFKSRFDIQITGVRSRKKSNLVLVEGQEVHLDDADFVLFLRIALQLWLQRDGYLLLRDIVFGEGDESEEALVPSGWQQALSRLRKNFRGRVGDLTPLEFIELSQGRVRLSTHHHYVRVNCEALLEHQNKKVRSLAAKLKLASESLVRPA